jgi:hypothetical protein
MTRYRVRPATAADVSAFYGRTLPVTVRAWVAEADGSVEMVAGYANRGEYTEVFSDSTDAIRANKFGIARAAKQIMAEVEKHAGRPLIAAAESENSRRALEFLGFEHLNGDAYIWPL